MVGLDWSGNSSTRKPFDSRYSVMPSTLVTLSMLAPMAAALLAPLGTTLAMCLTGAALAVSAAPAVTANDPLICTAPASMVLVETAPSTRTLPHFRLNLQSLLVNQLAASIDLAPT